MDSVIGMTGREAEKHLIYVEGMCSDKLERYLKFLKSKAIIAQPRGLADPGPMNPNLKPHYAEIAAWMIRGGARACFAAFGLHKTSIQLQILGLDSISGLPFHQDGGFGLIICPPWA